MQKFLFNFIFCLSMSLSTLTPTFAQGLFSAQDASGCPKNDPFLPTLVVCGRSPATGACSAYTNPCTLGDLVETGRRLLLWVISIVLLILPVFIAIYGVQVMYYRVLVPDVYKMKGSKEKLLYVVIYLVCMLGAWLIVKSIVDIVGVNNRINTFLIDGNGTRIQAKEFDYTR